MRMHLRNSRLLPPIIVVLLTVGAFLAITTLIERVDSSRRAQLASTILKTQTVQELEAAPYTADPHLNSSADGRSPELAAIVARQIRGDEAKISDGLSAALRSGASAAVVAHGRSSLALAKTAVAEVYAVATGPGGLAGVPLGTIAVVKAELVSRLGAVSAALGEIDNQDAARARLARTQAEVGTAIAMLLLLGAFGLFYIRSDRLGRENETLLGLSREEATTDVLTGLGNRRKLIDDLAADIEHGIPGSHELLVAIFDLNGFKQYNDTFGHASGDALLARLGGRLARAVTGSGKAYRMGGDEFCILASCAHYSGDTLLADAVAALSDGGEAWHIGCSHGAVWVPAEATTPADALQIADTRMYAVKASRSSTGRQVADALVQVLSEQDKGMNVHGDHVASLSRAVAEALHQPEAEVHRIELAATLHDIGKTALPDSLLNKPGPLNAQEWEFMHRHTAIGERIILAAPALANTAPLVRSSHERIDGDGYPDGLAGNEIPLGARIIFACDAFDAMTSVRSYRGATSNEVALEELRRCSGSQFDPEVVKALGDVIDARRPAPITALIA
jgi:diguanylate cyclase (GGDEF)-like protein